ncbi:Indoleamine 2,3-dioxygenase [Stachybotrys elegans]|uniref:Indoleamine 2,3-dioxygenase n=1 Tax=Stachybotrys elegans TaxID=80388 RepID=A0A8K0SH34_9HYPO|nr:Indoleamine 2,3-dioxygenase [Stachybotrys elegans]
MAHNLMQKYGLAKTRGFLPGSIPADAFENSYYTPWDNIATNLHQLIASHTLSEAIADLPLLSTKSLGAEPEWQRAYVVLSCMVQAVVWASREQPTECVPPQISEPYLEVCQKLGMQQILSYAGLCMWNWKPYPGETEHEHGFYDLSQLTSLVSFTGTRGEDAFNHVPVLIEAEGGVLVFELLQALDHADAGDVVAVSAALDKTAQVFERMTAHLPKLYGSLDANHFYHTLRPYLAGGKGAEDKGLPRGFVFQKRDGNTVELKHTGVSAAQSSLFPFLDLILGIEHQGTIFQEMRRYMPRNHREFLTAVSERASLRSFVDAQDPGSDVCRAFDGAVRQLRVWRSTHIAIVSKYVVRPARQSAGVNSEADFNDAKEDIKGTAGSALIPFLKQSRDETRKL